MADNQEDRHLEVVKLRITFLQHISTLSGAATLVILAIVRRATDPFVLFGLGAIIPSMFALTAVVSVAGIAILIIALEEGEHRMYAAGRLITGFAALSFGAVVVTTMTLASLNNPYILAFIFAVFYGVPLLVLVIIKRRVEKKRRSNETGENGEDQDATSGP